MLPLDLPVQLEIGGGDAGPWQGVSQQAAAPGLHYAACLDVSPLRCAGRLLQAVHEAAIRFAARHAQQASLTLLLPPDHAGRWQDAGDGAAARMLVSTLACEWGGRALRINALEVAPTVAPGQLHALLHYLCGPAAQYVTGQTLVSGGMAAGEAR